MREVVDTVTAADILEGLPPRLHHIVQFQARERPQDAAFVENGRTWTYDEFFRAVGAVASELWQLGIRRGDRVVLASENSVSLAAFIFACGVRDAWPIVANPRLSPRELEQIYTHSGAHRIFITTNVSREAANHAARLQMEIREVGPFAGIGVGTLNALTQQERYEEDPARQVAALMYTSGTTGKPKGVMLSHRNVLFAARTSVLLRNTGPDDHIYAVLPMSHIVGFSILLVATLMGGATCHIVAKYDPAALARAIAEDGITHLFGVPATYHRLLEFKAVNGIARLERGRLHQMFVAGAPLDLALKARIEGEFGCPLLNNYGITECSPGLTGVRSHSPRTDDSVGRFLPGIEYRLLNADRTSVKHGEVGELHVRGPNVMLGYYHAPDLTSKAIDPDGWFNTGDLARLDAEGYLFIVGRSKELIIRSGFNVYPAEVEGVLNSHEKVLQSAVIGRPVPGNEEVVAFVQLLPGADIDTRELLEYACRQLTSYKRPSEIILLDALPTAATGKILKHKLWQVAGIPNARNDASAREQEIP